MRATVALLDRNIKIIGENKDDWGGHVLIAGLEALDMET